MDEIKRDIKEIKDTLVRNTTSLEVHIARTLLAEQRLDALELYHRWMLGLVVSSLVSIALKIVFR